MEGDNPIERKQRAAKGKEKDKEEAPVPLQSRLNDGATTTEQTSSLNSFISRMASSTTQLAQDLIASHATEREMASIAPSNKGETSAAAQLQNGSSATDIATWRSIPLVADPDASFRSPRNAEMDKSHEAGFSAFLDHEGRPEQAEADGVRPPLPRQGLLEAQQLSRDQKSGNAVDRVEDGSEVVELLNSGYDDAVDVGPGVSLSVEDKAALRRALFQDDGQWRQRPATEHWGELLDFTPDFLSRDRAGDTDMLSYLGTSEPKEAREIWVSHWQDVLSSYTDEVWGNLSVLVGEAREELDAISGSRGEGIVTPESGALRRLQQILSHVRGF